MTLGQRIVLIAFAIILLFGSLIILILPGLHLFSLLEFYLMTFIPGGLFFYAFSKSDKPNSQQMKNTGEKPKVLPNSKDLPEQPNKPIPIPERSEQVHTIFDKVKKDPTQRILFEKPETINPTLLRISALFPFQLFPDILIIEESQISIIRKSFFKVATTETLPIQDIGSVNLNTGPFFASISFHTKFTPSVVEVQWLKKNDAIKAKQILDGLMLNTDKVIQVPKELPTEIKQEIFERAGSTPQVAKEI